MLWAPKIKVVVLLVLLCPLCPTVEVVMAVGRLL